MIIGGIDEVRRGPILGPMVMALVTAEEQVFVKLKELGVKDSKRLSRKRREDLEPTILGNTETFYKIIEPAEIDATSRNPKGRRLNYLEAVKAAEMINISKAERVILDCPEPKPEIFIRNVTNHLLRPVIIEAYHKADRDYPAVGAASIVAKVEGDRRVAKIRRRVGVDFGSGYPSDKRTRDFVNTLLIAGKPLPPYIRKSWKTLTKLRQELEQKTL